MNLGFCPLASSSKGNSYIIKSEETFLLVDVGISGNKIKDIFKFMNISKRDIKGILITHEHSDHIKGVSKTLTFTEDCTVYCSKGTKDAIIDKVYNMTEENTRVVSAGETFMAGDIEVTAFSVSHDASEPLAYSFKKNGKKISIVTDTGIVTDEIQEAIADSDILALESNHEVNILLYGRYPYNIKRRILSDYGHLSNEASGKCLCDFLKNLNGSKVPHVCLAHLSQENNTPEQAVLTIRNVLEEEDFYIGKNLRLEVLGAEEVNDMIII
ncbi:MAG: MBL fold metallo-hydrolase [Firmicutes bacterium]|nr:MBL fold metallo-hydrolase [Bacillota bacterium]